MSLQDPLLGVPPLQDWTEVRAGQGIVCCGSPMSLGSLAPGSALALALRVHTWLVMPSTFGRWEGLPRSTVEEEDEEMDAAGSDDADQAQD